jgi:murein DD-endopeptidase MepM/ murein hydrolase activator NlpD
MRTASRLFLVLLAAFVVGAPPSYGATGGASADAAAGGPLDAGALPYGAPVRQRPIARTFEVTPGSVRQGASLKLRLRVDERGVKRVAARIVVLGARSGRTAARFSLGSVRTGRTLTVGWPKQHLPAAGTYLVRLHVRDPHGSTLARAAASTGKSRLIVRPRPRPERPQTQPRVSPTPPAAVPTVPVVPVTGAAFPVAGPHSYGGDDGKFGAGRNGHTHEGQDVMAAEGTPLVSPVPGTVRHVANQPSAAGWYVVLDADDGRAMFFAHLQAGSASVAEGQRVTAGQALGRVGSTGRASGPHLHFEIWTGGWRDRGGTPIDPLPTLLSWDR